MSDNSNPHIEIREADSPDIACIARVAVKSLLDDPTFDYLWSNRLRYPEDNYFFWLHTLKGHLFDPHFTMLVATIKPLSPVVTTHCTTTTQPVEMIIAFGLWERNGRSAASGKRHQECNTWYNFLHRL